MKKAKGAREKWIVSVKESGLPLGVFNQLIVSLLSD